MRIFPDSTRENDFSFPSEPEHVESKTLPTIPTTGYCLNCAALQARADNAEAEVKRLREVFSDLAKQKLPSEMEDVDCGCAYQYAYAAIVDEARAALER